MIITHDISWPQCLSNQLFPAIKKGWKDRKEKIHFFWGLGANNLKEIEDVKRDGDFSAMPLLTNSIADEFETFFSIFKSMAEFSYSWYWIGR